MSGPVASNSLLFNLGMRYPTAATAIAIVATAVTLNSPIEVAENVEAPADVPVLLKTIAG